jgi:hypothetical protein
MRSTGFQEWKIANKGNGEFLIGIPFASLGGGNHEANPMRKAA